MLDKTGNTHMMGLSKKEITSLVFKTVKTCKSFKSTRDLRVHLLNRNVMKKMLKTLDSDKKKKEADAEQKAQFESFSRKKRKRAAKEDVIEVSAPKICKSKPETESCQHKRNSH